MLEFNQEHKVADLSSIKSKTEKVKYAGKVMLSGITISAILLLSGCSASNTNTDGKSNEVEQTIPTSAIIMEDGNAMIVDLCAYEKYTESRGGGAPATLAEDKLWTLYTSTGDIIIVDYNSVKIIMGEDSHEKAETIAESLISENGKITCFNEIKEYGKSK